MAFDGFFIRKLVGEIEENILGAHINKINNISTDEFILTIRKRKNFKLLLSASSSSSRFQLTKNTYENPNTPSNFCTVLRKYLIGGIIQSIEQINNDRIIVFKIKNFDELSPEQKACISGVKETKHGIEVTFYNKEKALEMLGRHLGMFTEKLEVKGELKTEDPFKGLSTEELKKVIFGGDK